MGASTSETIRTQQTACRCDNRNDDGNLHNLCNHHNIRIDKDADNRDDGFCRACPFDRVYLNANDRPDGTLFNTVIDIDRYLYATVGENICMTTHFGGGYYDETYCWTGTPEQIRSAAQWMFKLLKDSPGHYENMVKAKYEDTGIGVTYAWSDTGIPMFYTVQLFGKEVK